MGTKRSTSPKADLTTVVVDYNTITTPLAIVAAPAAGTRIRVWEVYLHCAGNVGVKFFTGSTALTGVMKSIAGTQIDLRTPARPSGGGGANVSYPVFECADAEAFNMVLDAAVAVAGWVSYTVETADNCQLT